MIFTASGMDPESALARRINAAATAAARDEVRRAIVAAGGSVSAAAALLGVSVVLVYRYVDALGLGSALDRARRANRPRKRGRGRPPVSRSCTPQKE